MTSDNGRCPGQIKTTDGLTDKLLKRKARKIGYKERDYTVEPIDEQFFRRKIPFVETKKHNMGEGKIATIYSFNINDINDCQKFVTVGDRRDRQWHAVDYPIENSNGKRDYLTLYFDHLPCPNDIRSAIYITRIRAGIENRELSEQFICHNCCTRKHWTQIFENDEKDHPLEDYYLLVKDNICNCEGGLEKLKPDKNLDKIDKQAEQNGRAAES